MIVVYPFFPGDQDLALKNAKWMNTLGGCKAHDCLMIVDKRCIGAADKIREEIAKAFNKFFSVIAGAQIDGWPEGANYFFRLATSMLAQRPELRYFLWMEPDAIPMREGWLDAIQAEYERSALPSGKLFMGDRVQVENIPIHMSGVGIYPNPLHAYAGEAYRAHDLAWDMAGAKQIVPRAHWTKLIEHAWKHPSFKTEEELNTQIRPEAVLFHSSKDGSLIDLLRSKREGNIVASKLREQPGAHQVETKEAGEKSRLAPPGISEGGDSSCVETSTRLNMSNKSGNALSNAAPTVQPAGAAPTCDIFIRTYPKDYPWLMHCLHSIQKFCTGFRKVWVVSPEASPFGDVASPGGGSIEWKVMNDESEDGYLAQQITKLYADVITDYQADHILHVDSDVIFTEPVTPRHFFSQPYPPPDDREFHSQWEDAKPAWPYTPYSTIKTPWQSITEKFMGEKVENEFMRRFPILIPRWLYPKLREFCHARHGRRIISEYVRNQPLRSFSEFNALGAYAFKYHHDKFFWINTVENPLPPPFARQFFSHGGITPEVKAEIEQILGGTGVQGEPATEVSEFPSHATPAQTICSHSPEVATPSAQSAQGFVVAPTEPPPVTPLPVLTKEEIAKIVPRLALYAGQSVDHRKSMMKFLSKHGLTPRWPRKKKKKT